MHVYVQSSIRRTFEGYEGMDVHCGGVVLMRVYTEPVCIYSTVLRAEYNNV